MDERADMGPGSHSRADVSSESIGQTVQSVAQRLIENVGKVIVGKREAITLVAVALLADGHVLLEDVPGVGKTMLAKAVARSIGGAFQRIQFTPDLMPSDVTGINVFNQKSGEFQFRPGPIMGNIILADEINRATPRAQACLLEAMEEHQVTIDAVTRALPAPFFVLATQNPIEQEGTFPLPESQLDRFLLSIGHGYPSAEDEDAILLRFERDNPLDHLQSVVSGGQLLEMQSLCRRIFVHPLVRAYLIEIVRSTRVHPGISLGGSPRATQRLYRAAQALAAIRGREFVSPDDVQQLVVPVLAHRLMVRAESRLRGQTSQTLLSEILRNIEVPLL